ncbi:MAG: hypoxanthine phosphoribosyltransferase [Deltaproteobacteria bacterium]|nr:hypoxanthine phosphoribosyltransferase [Deltaproteobacteria bacterium]
MDKKVLIPRERIRERVQELGVRLSEDYRGKEPVLIGILNGVVFFFVELVMAMSIPLRIDFIKASSYGSSMTSSGKIRLLKGLSLHVKNQDLILVEDIVDTGLTLKHILDNLRTQEPASIKICALIDKKERRKQPINLDYCGFTVNEGFLVGYGLDFNEQYRYLPDICVIE